MLNPHPMTSNWSVLDESGRHVGNIIHQHGSTLWSLQRRGVDRPFKRDIPSLDAAKALAAAYPQFWAGRNFKLSQSLKAYALCEALRAAFAVAVHFVAVS